MDLQSLLTEDWRLKGEKEVALVVCGTKYGNKARGS